MSDDDTSGESPGWSTEDEHQVREVLQSQGPVSMPSDVAVTLHAALAAEATERADPARRDGSVSAITDAPRRMWFRRLAPQIAAAAVVLAVLAVVLPQVIESKGGGSDSATSGGEQAAAPARPSASAGAPADAEGRKADGLDASDVVRLSSSGFAGSVARNVVDAGVVVPPTGLPAPAELSCVAGQVDSPDGVAATVDGRDARLFAEASGDAVTYRAYGCTGGNARVLGSATLTS